MRAVRKRLKNDNEIITAAAEKAVLFFCATRYPKKTLLYKLYTEKYRFRVATRGKTTKLSKKNNAVAKIE